MPGDAFLNDLLARFWEISWQASVIAGLVVLLRVVFGRVLDCRWRHALWLLLLCRLLMPVSPQSRVSVFGLTRYLHTTSPRQSSERFQAWVPADNATEHVTTISIDRRPASWAEAASVSEPLIPVWKQPRVLASAWFVVAAALILRLAWVNARFQRHLRRTATAPEPRSLELLESSARALKLRRMPVLLVTDLVTAPAACGVFRPKLLLPASLEFSLPNTQLRLVLLHELMHIQCNDVAIDWVWAIMQSLHWFNPVFWLVAPLRRSDRELARDEMVLQLTGPTEADQYGRTLLGLAGPVRLRLFCPGLIGLFNGRRQLRQRVTMIARFEHSRATSAWVGIGIMTLLAGCTLTGSPKNAAENSSTKPLATFAATTRPTTEVSLSDVEALDTLDSPTPAQAGVVTRRYDINDLLFVPPDYNNLPDFLGSDPAHARQSSEERASSPANNEEARAKRVEEIQRYIVDNVDPKNWKINGGEVGSISSSPLRAVLLITQTPENHRKIQTALDGLRATWGLQVSVETRCIILDDADEAQLPLAIRQRLATVHGAGRRRTDQVLSDGEFRTLIEAVGAIKSADSSTCPRLTLFDGQSAVLVMQTQQAYVAGMTLIESSGQKTYQPSTDTTTKTGVTEKVLACVAPDGQSVFVNIQFEKAGLAALVSEQFAGAPADKQVTVQVPVLSGLKVNRACSIPDRGTLLLGGELAQNPSTPSTPYVGSNEKIAAIIERDRHRNAYLLIKPTILRAAAAKKI